MSIGVLAFDRQVLCCGELTPVLQLHAGGFGFSQMRESNSLKMSVIGGIHAVHYFRGGVWRWEEGQGHAGTRLGAAPAWAGPLLLSSHPLHASNQLLMHNMRRCAGAHQRTGHSRQAHIWVRADMPVLSTTANE